jgi:mannose-6-phosphate isomerase-like protein (cupin superfamily)
MTSSAEKIGSALGKAFKSTVAKWKEGESAPVMYRTNLRDVPKVEGLKRDDGWVDMQVQFLIDKKTAGADHVVGWTVLKPGARHENHRHHNCDEFFIVLKGHGMIYTEHGDKPSVEGDVVYSPRGCWHGFNNTSNEDVVLVWGWMGPTEASGYKCIRGHKQPWDLIKKGMSAQLAKRRARIAAGEKPLGWKVGLGAPATMQKMGLTAPVVGYLMQRALLLSGSTASLKGYAKPVAEPEICVRMAHDLRSAASPGEAAAAVKEIFPAIELATLIRYPRPTTSMPYWKAISSSATSFCAAIPAWARAPPD